MFVHKGARHRRDIEKTGTQSQIESKLKLNAKLTDWKLNRKTRFETVPRWSTEFLPRPIIHLSKLINTDKIDAFIQPRYYSRNLITCLCCVYTQTSHQCTSRNLHYPFLSLMNNRSVARQFREVSFSRKFQSYRFRDFHFIRSSLKSREEKHLLSPFSRLFRLFEELVSSKPRKWRPPK